MNDINRRSLAMLLMIPITNVLATSIDDEDLPPGIISKEPIDDETCPDGYEMTKDGEDYVRTQEVD